MCSFDRVAYRSNDSMDVLRFAQRNGYRAYNKRIRVSLMVGAVRSIHVRAWAIDPIGCRGWTLEVFLNRLITDFCQSFIVKSHFDLLGWFFLSFRCKSKCCRVHLLIGNVS